jgi:hypothetical protein
MIGRKLMIKFHVKRGYQQPPLSAGDTSPIKRRLMQGSENRSMIIFQTTLLDK